MIVPLTTNTVLFIAVAQTVTDSRVMTSTRGTEWIYKQYSVCRMIPNGFRLLIDPNAIS